MRARTAFIVAFVAFVAGLLGLPLPAQAQSPWNSVTLTWTTPGDDSLIGNATQFDLRFSTSPITAANFASATAAASPPTPTAAGTTQTFTVRGLSRQRAYYFAMKAIDDASNSSDISNVANASTTDTMAPGRITTLVAGFFWFAWHTGSNHAVKPHEAVR